MSEDVNATPSKVFFVKMLTRDIDLDDAILDLLDNCVDGVHRQLRLETESVDPKMPFKGYWAEITVSPEEFSILDNCGGIPRDIAKESAFRLGRPDLQRDSDIATVGMYGIGMKRAMFKMGMTSRVVSQHQDDSYQVRIPADWLDDDDNWMLTLEEYEGKLESDGTEVRITDLHETIKRQFDLEQSNFVENLKRRVSELYSIILRKGFSVRINGEMIERARLDILTSGFSSEPGIQPYLYKAVIDDVDVDLVVGFYRRLATDSEIEAELQMPRRRDNAGWTIICNDRVVLHRDKSEVTGWGSGNVPKFHTQFIAIAGVVRFSSTNSANLPLNTTKRGLDMASPVYWHAREFMMEGLKKFTDFTNHWKGREFETTEQFENLRPMEATEISSTVPDSLWRKVPKSEYPEERVTPQLPRPKRSETRRRVTFVRLRTEVELLGRFFFDDRKASPSDIGNRCFDDALTIAREAA